MFVLENVKVGSILDIAHLEIPSGMVTCIIGESGSGKTTLLKLLNNLISCDEGTILINGTPITQIDPVELRRKIVMLSQTPAIFKGTVKDNLLIGLQFSEMPQASDAALKKALEAVQLSKDLNQDASLLSGGEKQRLALARVLLMKPDVLLLDEPSSALDEETTKFVMEQLVKFSKSKQKTMVMVTHSKTVVQLFAEYIVEIQKGRLVLHKEVQE